jgi:hypothetical protein
MKPVEPPKVGDNLIHRNPIREGVEHRHRDVLMVVVQCRAYMFAFCHALATWCIRNIHAVPFPVRFAHHLKMNA